MKCVQDRRKKVLSGDCAVCLTYGDCHPICAKREFIFGRKDEKEPLWALTVEEAREKNEDLSWFWNSREERHENKLVNGPPKIPDNLKWDVWERDDFTCQHCGVRRHLSIDHIIPRARGGETTRENCQTLCRHCNSKKGASDG